MQSEERFKFAIGTLIIVFILLYFFNFSFFLNLIIFCVGATLFFFSFIDLEEPEDRIYSQINQEIKNGDIKTTLWTKAEALTDGGNEQQVKSKYVKLRFEQIKEDGF